MDGASMVWDHFKLNADQRLKAFNFFVLLSIFADGGALTALSRGSSQWQLFLIGGFIIVLAGVFLLVDIRSRRLLLLTIPALRHAEGEFPAAYRLFSNDAARGRSIVSYTFAFRFLIAFQFLVGVALVVIATQVMAQIPDAVVAPVIVAYSGLAAVSWTQVTAIAAAIAAIASVVVAYRTMKLLHEHHVRSVVPLPEILAEDYEDCLKVAIKNSGAGPAIVSKVVVSDGVNSNGALIDWMPEQPQGRYWRYFQSEFVARAVLPGDELNMLELERDEKESQAKFNKFRDEVRTALSQLTIVVSYSDIYGTALPDVSRKLDWFAREK